MTRGQLIKKKRIDARRFIWLVRVQTRDGNGKLRSRSKTIRGTKTDAEKAKTELLAEKDLGMIASPQQTLNDFLDTWLKLIKPKLHSRTHHDYTEILARYIRAPLGGYKLQDLRTIHFQGIYSDMQNSKKLAPRTIRYTNTIIKSALRYAVNQDLLRKDPTIGIVLPKAKKREATVLSQEECVSFLDAANSERIGALFSFLLATGCRPSEAIGLKWADVSFDSKTVEIKRVVVWNRKGGGWAFSEPKTSHSRRTIPLPWTIVEEIKKHKIAQNKERLKLGPDWSDFDLVFPSEVGTPLTMSRISRVFKRIKKKVGITGKIRLYDLRHTSATLLLKANINPKVISERLGHSSITLTLDVYSHVLPTMQLEATESLEGMIFRRTGS